jgi:ribosomal protein L32
MRSMTSANNPENKQSHWQPGQSGNPSGRSKGTRDLAGYVLETTDGGKELVDALVSLARGVMPNVAAQKSSKPRKDQQVRPADQLKAIEMLLDRGFGQVTTATRHSPQCLRQAARASV